jgi:hypothetical protein
MPWLPPTGWAGADEAKGDDASPSRELAWLRSQLATHVPSILELLEGRLKLGCTWDELGQRHGWHPRMA